MEHITSKLTSKGQITVPKAVREALGFEEGDAVVFEVGEESVTLRKMPTIDPEWLRAVQSTLTEWADDLDDDL